MTRNSAQIARPLRMLAIDLGVALVVIVALAASLLLRAQVVGRTAAFTSPDLPLQFAYPAAWREAGTLQDTLLHVEDSYVESPFKTTLTVVNRALDPAAPPALEVLTNRQIEERSTQTGFHFISSDPAQVAGASATEIVYAYVVQPIDEPRRPSLPVVVQAREFVVLAGDQSYYFSLAAPESDFARASAELDRVIASVRL